MRFFNRLGIGHRVGKAVVAGDRLGNHLSVTDGRALQQLFAAFVGIKVPQLQEQHVVAHHAKTKMARLDNPGMNRPDSHFTNTFAIHF